MSVVAGYSFTCARKSDSTVWCRGKNDNGQTGATPGPGTPPTPTRVTGFTASAIFAQDCTATVYAFP